MPPQQLRRDFFDIFPCYPAQRAFIGGRLRTTNHLFLGGVGTGKTKGLCYSAVLMSKLNPNTDIGFFGRTGRDCTTTLIPMFMDAVEQYQDATGDVLIDGKGYNRTTRIATVKGGGRILFRPYDRIDKVRSLTLSVALIDEIEFASVPSREAFMVIQARVRAPGAPFRQLKIATTPDGLQGCTAHFLDRQQQADRSYRCVRATVYDNPFVDDEYRENLKAACTPRQWRQEGLGEILKPTNAVFSEYDESVHVIPYSWPKNSHKPWILAVDWGTSNAFFAAIVIEDDGRWVVAYEEKHEDTSRAAFRNALVKFVRSRATEPVLIAPDRAVPDENNWAVGTFRNSWVRWMKDKSEQAIINGIEAVRYMLDPMDGDPLLYFSDSLAGPVVQQKRGIRSALTHYRNKRDAEGNATNEPYKCNIFDHPCDALRYAVVAGADRKDFHGGRFLPFIMPTRRQDRPQDLAYG